MERPPAHADKVGLRTNLPQEKPDEGWEFCAACGTPIDVSAVQPLTAMTCPNCGKHFSALREFGPYMLHQLLGQGGMSVVYRAMDRELERFIALKLLREDFSSREAETSRLAAEAATLASINDPHVVRVYSTGSEYGHFYIAMELLSGGTLQQRIERSGPLEESAALEVALQAASGLQAVFRRGILHRDVKPGNILFADDHTVKLVDFGLAAPGDNLPQEPSDEILGTADYIPPERAAHGKEDFRSDIYSLGATLYHALSGRPPFEAVTPYRVAVKRLTCQPLKIQTFVPDVSPATAFCLDRMLARNASDRFQSYEELIDYLKYAQHEISRRKGKAEPPSRVVVETEADQKRSGFLALGVLLACALLAFAVLYPRLRTIPKPAESKENAAKSQNADDQAKWFLATQQLLVAGKASMAANAFGQLSKDPKTPEPMLQWCISQEGLAWLADGNLSEARARFRDLAAHPYNADASDGEELRKLFSTLSAAVAGEGIIPASTVDDNDDSRAGAIKLLVYGLKNWALGDFEDAVPFFRQFEFSNPEGRYGWIKEYQPIAADYLADFSRYHDARVLLIKAEKPSDYIDAARTIDTIRGTVKREGVLLRHFDRMIEEARKKAAGNVVESEALIQAREKRLRPLDLNECFTADSRKGLFQSQEYFSDTLYFRKTGMLRANNILFHVADPSENEKGFNLILLRGGRGFSKGYPMKVEIPVPPMLASRIHLLGCVAGWGYPMERGIERVAAITIHHANGESERTELRNGLEICDYGTAKAQVPNSRLVPDFVTGDRQIRTMPITVSDTTSPIVKITMDSFDSLQAVLFAGVTVEMPEALSVNEEGKPAETGVPRESEEVIQQREKRLRPLNLNRSVTADSRKGLFQSEEYYADSLYFRQTGLVRANNILFQVIDPTVNENGLNLILLRGGRGFSKKYPMKVEIPVPRLPASRIHLLGCVAGWGYPMEPAIERVASITIHHVNGKSERAVLKNGLEISDYGAANAQVPNSRAVPDFVFGDRQIRTMAIDVSDTSSPIDKITMDSYDSLQAVLFAGVTVELPERPSVREASALK